MNRALELQLVELLESLRSIDDALRTQKRACRTERDRAALEAQAARALSLVDRMTAQLEET